MFECAICVRFVFVSQVPLNSWSHTYPTSEVTPEIAAGLTIQVGSRRAQSKKEKPYTIDLETINHAALQPFGVGLSPYDPCDEPVAFRESRRMHVPLKVQPGILLKKLEHVSISLSFCLGSYELCKRTRSISHPSTNYDVDCDLFRLKWCGITSDGMTVATSCGKMLTPL